MERIKIEFSNVKALYQKLLFLPVLFFSLSVGLRAQFPRKPITIVVHSKPGSAIDITARQIAAISRKYTSVPILVENKSGGSGIVAMRTVLSRPPDGYTILGVTKSFISTVLLTHGGVKLSEFYFLACMAVDPEALITNRTTSVRTLDDIIADARAKHGKQRWLGPLVGGVDHLMAVKTWDVLNIRGEWIPYEGGSDALAALMGKQGAVYVGNPGDTRGRPTLKVAAVAAPERLSQFPNAPTFVEKGYDLKSEVLWRGFAVRKGTDLTAIHYLTRLLQKVSRDSAWLAFLHQTSAQAVFYGHRQFERMILQDQQEAVKYLQKAGILAAAQGGAQNWRNWAVLLGGVYFFLLGLVYFLKREWLSGDTVIAGFLLVFSLFLFILTKDFPRGKLATSVGPASMPRLWIYGLWIFCTWLVFQTVRGKHSPKNSDSGNVRIPLGLVGLMFGYLLAIRYAGYYVSTVLFLSAGAYQLNYRKYWIIVVTVLGFVVLSYVIFYRILQVPLPRGMWFE